MKSRFNTAQHQRPLGFTLVELLVVITIVVALAAIGFTSFRSIRQSANASTSSSNMRQLGVALQTYVADKGRYPSTGQFGSDEFTVAWDRILMPYLGNPDFDYKDGKNRPFLKNSAAATAMGPAAKILFCPGDLVPAPPGEMRRSYALCPWTCTQGGNGFKNGFDLPIGSGALPSLVSDPSRAVVMVEFRSKAGRAQNLIGSGNYENMFGFMGQPQAPKPITANYHKNSQFLLFVDGHIDSCPGDIEQVEWEGRGYSPHKKSFGQ